MSIMCHHNFFTTEPGNHSCRYPYKRFNTQCYTRWLSALKPHPQNPKTPRTNRRRSSWFLKNTWLKICRVAAAAQVQHKLEAVLFYQEYQPPAKLPLRLLRTGRASIQTSEKHNKDLIMRKQDRISNLNFLALTRCRTQRLDFGKVVVWERRTRMSFFLLNSVGQHPISKRSWLIRTSDFFIFSDA